MKAIYFISILYLLLISTCERATNVKLEGENPPVFVLSGSGELGDLVIYGSKQRDIAGDRAYALWEIQPVNGYLNGRSVNIIGSIKYGVVPQGYKQVYPENGLPPPALVEGQKYEYWFQTINAPHARGHFEIRGNKAVELKK